MEGVGERDGLHSLKTVHSTSPAVHRKFARSVKTVCAQNAEVVQKAHDCCAVVVTFI